MAKAKDTRGLKVVTQEAQDVEKQFADLFDSANKKTPGAEAAASRLRELMRANEGEKLWRRVQGPMASAEAFALEHCSGMTPGVNACWRPRLVEMRQRLAGDNPSEVETLLAQHAALSWLRLAEVDSVHGALI